MTASVLGGEHAFRKNSLFPSILWISSFLLGFVIPAGAAEPQSALIVSPEVKHDTSRPLRDIALPAQAGQGVQRLMTLARPTRGPFVSAQPDRAAQTPQGPQTGVNLLLNFDGQDADRVAPPDTTGAVGATQYVQWVNLEYNVYDKKKGTKILGPVQGNGFWSGFGGACETQNDGDIIIQYDKAAGRWVAAQPVFVAPYLYCIAVSTTSDATGSYNRYAFAFPAGAFPDYPKVGVWPDGYYATFNIFQNTTFFIGAMACAYDRSNMLAGNAATAVCFQQPPSVSSLLPSDLDGSTAPPAGSPNFVVGIADESNLQLFQFNADFANPANSSFTGPALIPVVPFSEICNRSIVLACIPEPHPGEKLDAISDRVMYRLAYRNFGDHESLVVNHTVAGGPLAGVRWYEIRSPGASPSVFQQGTVVDPAVNFWMGSIAMDKDGDIALGFSASSSTVEPSALVRVKSHYRRNFTQSYSAE